MAHKISVKEITEKTLKDIEVVSGDVSKKYVPIYTSEIVESLKPEFEFDYGYKFGDKSSKHYVQLKNKDEDIIRIYNSFDRSFALRIYFITDDLQFPLVDNGRIVHIGEKAKKIEDFKDLKKEILKSIPAIKELKANLENEIVDLDSEIIAEINRTIPFEVIYRAEYNLRKRKGDTKSKFEVKFDNYVDTVAKKAAENGNPLTVYQYLNLSIKNFIDGNYGLIHVLNNKETKKSGKKITSPFSRVLALFRINNKLQEVLPEYFI